MKRTIILFTVVLFFTSFLTSCSGFYKIYDEDDFLGRSSKEIVESYGKFDYRTQPADADGLYRNCTGGYLVREGREGSMLLFREPLYFSIYFDGNGIAEKCEYTEGHPGG